MALKRKLTKTEFDALTESIKANYKAGEEADTYVVDLDGEDDGVLALKRAKDRETQTARELRETIAKLEKDKREAETQLASLADSDAAKRGDIKALQTSYDAKLAAAKAEGKAALDKRDAYLRKSLVDKVATDLANEISTAPKLLLPHIRARLAADLDGEEPATVILGADGKISALTLDDLKKEFLADKDYSGILKGSKASGSGATQPGARSGSTGSKPSSPNAEGGNPLSNLNNPPGSRDRIDLTTLKPHDLAARVGQLKAERAATRGE